MARTKEEKRDRAVRELERLRVKRARRVEAEQAVASATPGRQFAQALQHLQEAAWSSEDTNVELKAAELLAEANEKSMSVPEARAWAADFVSQHPDAAEWAWRFVGRVEVHQQSPRGPRSDKLQRPAAPEYDTLVIGAISMLRPDVRRLAGKAHWDELYDLVNALCATRMLPKLDRQQLRSVARRVRPGR